MAMDSSTTLNQAAAHDTGLYDPTLHDNKIVAMYETLDRAKMARDKLIAAGVPAAAMDIMDRSDDRYAGGVDYERNTGLWAAMKGLFMPDEDAHGYAEGVNRGHSMLVVNPQGLTDRSRVISVLENTDPIDFDAKLEEWRQAGYTYPGEQVAGTVSGADASLATGASSYGGAPHLADTSTPSRPLPVSGPVVDQPANVAVTPVAYTTTAARPVVAPAVMAGAQEETLKVMEERLRVGKREVSGGTVRVRSYIVERPVEEQVSLHQERVHIERHAVDRPASAADLAAFQERTIEVTARSEEAVISKEARVVEEIGIRKDVSDRVETVRDTVRRTQVEVEDTTAKPTVTGTTTTTTSTTGTTGWTGGNNRQM